MNSLKKHILHGVIGAMLLGVMVSCSEDSIMSPEEPGDVSVSGGVTFRCADMMETFVGDVNPAGTRAAASKNPEEKAIKTLHIFLFNYEDGKLIDFRGFDNFQAYRKEINTSFINIPTSSEDFKDSEDKDADAAFKEFQEKFTNVRIVAIANIDATDEAGSYEDPANKFLTDYSPEGKILQAGRNEEADKDSKEKGNNGQPFKITSYDQLKKWIYYPRIRMNEDGSGDISKLPEAGMPMIGEYPEPVNLTEKKTRIVNLTALMAKVNVSVKLEPDQYTDEYPLLKITGYGVRNMPIGVPFVAPDGSAKNGGGKPEGGSDNERHADYFNKYNVTDVPMFHKGDNSSGSSHFICPDEAHEFLTPANVTINKDSEVATFSYYTFENINLPDYNATRANGTNAFDESLNPIYPDDLKKIEENDKTRAEAMKERWKSTFAYSDRASAMILKGEYTTHQGLTYKAQFTVFLGRSKGIDGVTNPELDFQVKRNHQYDNNIVIHGLDYIRNSDDEVYNFDGRVNVVDDNPFYLAIVNERKVDAHATALPMDVWFMLREDGSGNVDDNADWSSEITFTIRDHDDKKKGSWLRMEKITRVEMEKGRVLKDKGPLVPFAFGTGARDYFTTDLVTKTLKENGVADGKEHGWEIKVDADKDGSRSRIYFYIDENVPTSNKPNQTDSNASDYYGDRTATIDIIYVRKDAQGNVVDKRERTIEIEQRALLKVEGSRNGTVDTWMEYYEEYLDHSDPLDKHESPGELYSGLQWGLDGVDALYRPLGNPNGFKNPTGDDNYYQVYLTNEAFEATLWAIKRMGETSVRTVHLFNNNAPISAFHYCYGKNKRNGNGDPELSGKKGWYMPGISELEVALVNYYGKFNYFRNNFYWSASPGYEGIQAVLWNTAKTYARATKVAVNGTDISYAASRNSGDEGFHTRLTYNRVRSFYRVE